MTLCANLVVCLSLLPLTNGLITYSDPTLGEGTVATYTCNPLHTLSGNSTRICGSDGSWSGGSAPAGCKVVCPSLPPLTNGMISYSDPTLSEGTVATHTCSRIGYSPIGNTARICQSDRTWSGSSVTCQVVDCGPPIVPRHGQVHLPSGTTYGNFANYFCDECSNINGVSSVQYCGANGIWLLPAPTCQVLSECGLLATPINGNVEMSAGSECGSKADYNCTVGYELRGVMSRVCQVSGLWNGTMPSCERVDCGPLQSPINGILQTFGTLFMSEATYYCHRGYEISGASHRTCGADGQWRPNEPFCNPVECPTPAYLNNGLVTYSGTTFTNEATYSCDYGYTLQGSTTRTCNANGGWQPSEPFCQIVDCGPLQNPTNGMVDLSSSTIFMSIAIFTCDSGYTLEGIGFSQCLADGGWSSTEPICNAVDCGALEHPIYGSVDVSHGTTFGNEAVYSCSDGYLLIGQKKHTCTEMEHGAQK
ncbi:sushi, von Willebrand factor type A, EGF and pentraxin domain-containing protein 1-like [Halichondria panicea]|uniref:sushi, von Willebrand factor type A, EGF and pentraxin domain-containing protein 1-like n=1 Tax=Halichondria panicea TaxID=6063 RepID=UPI00312BAA7B